MSNDRASMRRHLFQVLGWPKRRTGRAYRRGMLQMAVISAVISHPEWQRLADLVDAHVYPITEDHLHAGQEVKEGKTDV